MSLTSDQQVAQLVLAAHDLVQFLRDFTTAPRAGLDAGTEVAELESRLNLAYRGVAEAGVVPDQVLTADVVDQFPARSGLAVRGARADGRFADWERAATLLVATGPDLVRERLRALPRLTVGVPTRLAGLEPAVHQPWLDQIRDAEGYDADAALAMLISPGRTLTATTVGTRVHAEQRVLDLLRDAHRADLLSASTLTVVGTSEMCPLCFFELLAVLAAFPRLTATVSAWGDGPEPEPDLDDEHPLATAPIVVVTAEAATITTVTAPGPTEPLATPLDPAGVSVVDSQIRRDADTPAGTPDTTVPSTTSAAVGPAIDIAALVRLDPAPTAGAEVDIDEGEYDEDLLDEVRALLDDPRAAIAPEVRSELTRLTDADDARAAAGITVGTTVGPTVGPTPQEPATAEPTIVDEDEVDLTAVIEVDEGEYDDDLIDVLQITLDRPEPGTDAITVRQQREILAQLQANIAHANHLEDEQEQAQHARFDPPPPAPVESAQWTDVDDVDPTAIIEVDEGEYNDDLIDILRAALDTLEPGTDATTVREQRGILAQLQANVARAERLEDEQEQARRALFDPPAPVRVYSGPSLDRSFGLALDPEPGLDVDIDEGEYDQDLLERLQAMIAAEPTAVDPEVRQRLYRLLDDRAADGADPGLSYWADPPAPEPAPSIVVRPELPVLVPSTVDAPAPSTVDMPVSSTVDMPVSSTVDPDGRERYPGAVDTGPAGGPGDQPIVRLVHGARDVVGFLPEFTVPTDRGQADHNNMLMQRLAARLDEQYAAVDRVGVDIAALPDETLDHLPGEADHDGTDPLARTLLRGARLSIAARTDTVGGTLSGRRLVEAIARLKVAEPAGPELLPDPLVAREWQALLQQIGTAAPAGPPLSAAVATLTLASGVNLTTMTTSGAESLVQAFIGGQPDSSRGRLPRYLAHPVTASLRPDEPGAEPGQQPGPDPEPRHADAEKKIFDYLITNHEADLDGVSHAELTLASSEGMCPSCAVVALQFLTDFEALMVTVRLWGPSGPPRGLVRRFRTNRT